MTVQLRPFFGYYGGKWRDAVKHYPAPAFGTVLCDVDPILVGVWDYLIRVRPSEILAIPDVQPGGSVDDLHLPQEARWLVGFWMNRGTASPRKSPSKWMRDGIRPGSFWGDRVRQTIAGQVDSIRHWRVFQCSYAVCPVEPRAATWFVDPPYQLAGRHYRFGSEGLDYSVLASWCRGLAGQVIVCENGGASWLPFRELADIKTTRSGFRSGEVVWTQQERAQGAAP